MFSRKTEIMVGIFMIVGIFSLVYLSFTLGKVSLFNSGNMTVTADFDSITGLRKGASVEIAGVRVGKVTDIHLNDDIAVVALSIDRGVDMTDDIIASIRTKGIIGEKYIKLTPGGSDEYIEDGGSIVDTESSISLEELISKYIFEK